MPEWPCLRARSRFKRTQMFKCSPCRIMHRFSHPPQAHFAFLMKMALFLLWLIGPIWLHAETISGTIQDPSGAVISGARSEVTGGDLTQPGVLMSDGLGKFVSPELKHGAYSVKVIRDGFESQVKAVDLQGAVQLQVTLTIAQQQVTITVPGKSLAFANSDPVYRQLRDVGLG